jgi:hypothetical protein
MLAERPEAGWVSPAMTTPTSRSHRPLRHRDRDTLRTREAQERPSSTANAGPDYERNRSPAATPPRDCRPRPPIPAARLAGAQFIGWGAVAMAGVVICVVGLLVWIIGRRGPLVAPSPDGCVSIA